MKSQAKIVALIASLTGAACMLPAQAMPYGWGPSNQAMPQQGNQYHYQWSYRQGHPSMQPSMPSMGQPGYMPRGMYPFGQQGGGYCPHKQQGAGQAHQGHGMGMMGHHQGGHHQGSKHHDYSQQQQPPRLGVAMQPLSQPELEKLGLEYGVRVEEVLPGSAAEKSGLKPDDIITALAERPVYSAKRLRYLVNNAESQVTVSLNRAGKELTVNAELGDAKASASSGKAYLGVRLQEMTEDLKEAFGATGGSGVLISQVMPGSPAEQAELVAGDVIASIGDTATGNIQEVHQALANHQPGAEVDISLIR
ncbi:MAG: PDZ domain-containing protein, partial [Gammaproteobacteria bacterium]